jgi:hypothetical protein
MEATFPSALPTLLPNIGEVMASIGLPITVLTTSLNAPPIAVNGLAIALKKLPNPKNSGSPVWGFSVPDPPRRIRRAASSGEIWARRESPNLPSFLAFSSSFLMIHLV